MADVTHYVRARKWLDDPETRIPDDVRAEIDALLAISTAERETAVELRRVGPMLRDAIEEASQQTRITVSGTNKAALLLALDGAL